MEKRHLDDLMWFPGAYINPASWLKDDIKVGIILLNSSLKGFENNFLELWRHAVYRVSVDGGCNEIVRLSKEHGLQLADYKPNFISGDFDSILPDNKRYLEKQGCKVIPTPDQDFTDFTKSLMVLKNELQIDQIEINLILIVVRHEGRYDQMFSNINTLFKATQMNLPPIAVISFDSLSWLLLPGRHSISLSGIDVTKECALVPIGGPCKDCTTSGLKWNLNHQSMQFGELISTSNTYEKGSKLVSIDASDPLLWIMQLL